MLKNRLNNATSFPFERQITVDHLLASHWQNVLRLTEASVRLERKTVEGQSKTLARCPMTGQMREASCSSPALWRFGHSAGKRDTAG